MRPLNLYILIQTLGSPCVFFEPHALEISQDLENTRPTNALSNPMAFRGNSLLSRLQIVLYTDKGISVSHVVVRVVGLGGGGGGVGLKGKEANGPKG